MLSQKEEFVFGFSILNKNVRVEGVSLLKTSRRYHVIAQNWCRSSKLLKSLHVLLDERLKGEMPYSRYIPVRRTIAIQVITGSVQNSFTSVAAWPKQNEIKDRIPNSTVVSRCSIPLPNKTHLRGRITFVRRSRVTWSINRVCGSDWALLNIEHTSRSLIGNKFHSKSWL